MFKKIFNTIKKDIKTNYKFYIILVIITMIFLIDFDYNIYSPGSLQNLNDRIEIDSSYNESGSFNLTYVTARKATIPNILLSYIIPNWDIVSIDDMRIEDENQNEIEERNKISLKQTSYDAVIAAFTEAGIEYNIDSLDIVVSYIYDIADTNLKIGDTIKSINGVNINNFDELTNEIAKYKENDKIKLNVLRNNKIIECYSVLTKENDKVIIGVLLSELKNISTTPKVEFIFKDNESGSSRGLMCALEIYNRITEFDLTKGRKISGTGSIDANGVVGSISGVKYKLAGAVKKKADIFIVPSENYDEAIKEKEKNNYDIEIIKADNLHQVIEELK